MSYEGLAWPSEPSATDLVDGTDTYAMGLRFTVTEGKDCVGVRWRVPDTLSNPPGGHLVALWTVSNETRVAAKAFVPTPGVYQDVLFDVPYALVAGTQYVVSVFTQHYVFRSGGGLWPSSPSGNVVANEGKLSPTTSQTVYPSSLQSGWYYVSPLVDTDDPTTPVTSTIKGKWRVYTGVTSAIKGKWQVFTQVVSTIRGKWNVITAAPEPPTANSAVLNAQRAATLAFIAYDPTNVEFIRSTRVATPSGGFVEVDVPTGVTQTVKMILLAYDQRPTVTQAGVERVIDYHVLARWDADIKVGDYWLDDAGTRWDIVGFSEGWDYETKAFASRHVPRGVNP